MYLYTHTYIYIPFFLIHQPHIWKLFPLQKKTEIHHTEHQNTPHSSCAIQSEEGCVAFSLQTPAMFGFSASAACDYFSLDVAIYFSFPMGTSGRDVGADCTITIHFQDPVDGFFSLLCSCDTKHKAHSVVQHPSLFLSWNCTDLPDFRLSSLLMPRANQGWYFIASLGIRVENFPALPIWRHPISLQVCLNLSGGAHLGLAGA